jgi:hypothetical protein
MAHFAYVIDGVVKKVHVLANAVILDEDYMEQESLGQKFLANLHGYEPSHLIQCSYNARIRGNYPAPGFTYDVALDAFIPPKPEPTDEIADWVLNEETFNWEPVEV